MRKVYVLLAFCWVGGMFLPNKVQAHNDSLVRKPESLRTFKKSIRVSGQFYIAADYIKSESYENLAYNLRRSYITVQSQLAKNLDVRYTQDLTVDGAGSVKLRIKYLYMRYHLPDLWIFTGNHIKFGVEQRPWLDFEEHIDVYRVQGSMFLERSKLFNSSGFGLAFDGLLGGKMNNAYIQKVHPNLPGRYGSIALGLFNGGGYHSIERNITKNFEARVTLRPLSEIVPGVLISWLGIFGTGNVPENPNFDLNAIMASYESQYLTVTAQYEQGRGNSFGTMNDSAFVAFSHSGYSFYGNFRIPKTTLALLARYDNFLLSENVPQKTQRTILGISWRFFNKNRLVFTYQSENFTEKPKRYQYDLAVDISF